MPRDVYSIRIFATGGLTAAAGTVGPTVPAGLVYVLRDIDAYETTGTVGANFVVLNQTRGWLWGGFRATSSALETPQWRGRQVYAEGEQVGFLVGSGTWAIAASGYQLTLP